MGGRREDGGACVTVTRTTHLCWPREGGLGPGRGRLAQEGAVTEGPTTGGEGLSVWRQELPAPPGTGNPGKEQTRGAAESGWDLPS